MGENKKTLYFTSRSYHSAPLKIGVTESMAEISSAYVRMRMRELYLIESKA